MGTTTKNIVLLANKVGFPALALLFAGYFLNRLSNNFENMLQKMIEQTVILQQIDQKIMTASLK